MKHIVEEMKWFLQQKVYIIAIAITAVCSYGFSITHYAIGIDDTAVDLYLEEGLEVVMGRWTVYLLNKLFPMSDFTPFMLEFVDLLLFLFSITLFCVLLRRILGEYCDILGYTIFACAFLSNPIISEVNTYYYHNGVDLGYGLVALALLFFMDAIEKSGKKRLINYFISMLFLWVAIGCYESLLILYIMGLIVILFLRGLVEKDTLCALHIVKNLGIGALLVVGSVLLRSVMIEIVTLLFGLQDMQLLEQRSLSEMLVLFRGREGLADFFMLLKRFWLVYHVNAIVYLPITVYEFACICIGCYSLVWACKKKNIWYPVLFVGMLITPVLLVIAEAKVTYYRSCQYLPFFAAVGVLLFYMVLVQGFKKARTKTVNYGRIVAVFLAFVLIYNQAEMMNRYFYIDYRKYLHVKDTFDRIVYEIEKNYDTDKKVYFAGAYDIPYEFMECCYVDYDSWQYKLIANITDLVDVTLKEKYHTEYGYCFGGEAVWSLIRWGITAFDGTNMGIIQFLDMHGYDIETITDKEMIKEAGELGNTMPRWPRNGSIAEYEDYIVVHF